MVTGGKSNKSNIRIKKMLNLIPENWYWSKSLKRDVKFVEIYTRFQGENYGKAYVEFMGENGNIGGAYLPVIDLRNTW